MLTLNTWSWYSSVQQLVYISLVCSYSVSPYKDNSTFSSLLIFPTALTHSFLMTLSSISIRKLKQLKENFHRCHHHIYSLPSICTDTVCSLFLLRWTIHASVHSQSFHLCSRSYSTCLWRTLLQQLLPLLYHQCSLLLTIPMPLSLLSENK